MKAKSARLIDIYNIAHFLKIVRLCSSFGYSSNIFPTSSQDMFNVHILIPENLLMSTSNGVLLIIHSNGQYYYILTSIVSQIMNCLQIFPSL